MALEPCVASTQAARLSFSIELEGRAASETHRRDLVALVRERSRLVHHDLFEFNFSSKSECVRLAARLDAQTERILAQLTFIRSIRDTHALAIAELASSVESNDFLSYSGLTVATPNRFIKRTFQRAPCALSPAAHVERLVVTRPSSERASGCPAP